jgi:hypothetical protein
MAGMIDSSRTELGLLATGRGGIELVSMLDLRTPSCLMGTVVHGVTPMGWEGVKLGITHFGWEGQGGHMVSHLLEAAVLVQGITPVRWESMSHMMSHPWDGRVMVGHHALRTLMGGPGGSGSHTRGMGGATVRCHTCWMGGGHMVSSPWGGRGHSQALCMFDERWSWWSGVSRQWGWFVFGVVPV